MVKPMLRHAALLLLLTLPACQERRADDLTARLLYTASGTYDPQADERRREGAGQRSVSWTTRPPLPATALAVRYDSDLRPASWQMKVTRPSFSAADLNTQPNERLGRRQVGTPQGEATLFTAGRLKDVLLLPAASGELILLTRGYASHHHPELLKFFTPSP